jgi:hypothetical protein
MRLAKDIPMRKTILSFFILTLLTSGLYFTQKSSAQVATTIAAAGTPLSTQTNFSWNYPVKWTNCSVSNAVPMAVSTFDVTTTGAYTFTMNNSGFTDGVIYLYQGAFNPGSPCLNIANNRDTTSNQPASGTYITGNTITVNINASLGSKRWIVVFSPKNQNQGGTFSATVNGPAAVAMVPDVTTTFAPAGTTLNAQNYAWQYPTKGDCTLHPGDVPFAAYTFDVAATGLYTFTMNGNGFNGVVHLYQTYFDPTLPCDGNSNLQTSTGILITGNSIQIPISYTLGLNRWVVVFSPQDTGVSGTFSATVKGPSPVTVVPATFNIFSQTKSKSVTSGCQQTLAVYATGPTPQTFQWYEGIAGDLSTSLIIPNATTSRFTTPALTSDKSYWVRVTQGSNHVDSDTIKFKVYQTNKTYFSGSLDASQNWNLTPTLCHPSGTFVHYQTIHVRIPASGAYTIHLNRDENFTSGYAINVYSGFFDATQPCSSFSDGILNANLVTHLTAGQEFIIVISSTTPGATGDFDGYISTNDDCSLPETIEDALIISGNPLDKAITPNSTSALTFAYIGGTPRPKVIQWYKGISGDTSQPINGAIQTNYTTPSLSQTPANQPTFYYYWARVTDPGSQTHADTRTAIVNVLNPPITYSDVLSPCDQTYTQVNGPTTFYKIFPFTVSTDGAYTFNITANGFTPAVKLYQSFFSPDYPNLGYYAPGSTQNLLASPNTFYLVITSTASNQTGSFTLNITGPALVIPTPRPTITAQPIDKIIYKNQTATLNVTSNTPEVSYQWYTGTCSDKTAITNATSNSYTTPPLTDYKDYWVKLSYGAMYVNSNIAHVRIKPQAITDGYIIDEDTPLTIAAPGLLVNDIKADSKTLAAFKVTDPTLGTRTLSDNGALSYTPNVNANGADVFTYKVSDGTLESDTENVAILVREVNDAPVRTAGQVQNHTFVEDGLISQLHLGGLAYSPGGGTDEASQQLVYKVTAVPPVSIGRVLLSDNTTIVAANTAYTLQQIRDMQFKPAPNGYGGPYPFTFTVTDNGTTRGNADPKSITESLNITVTPVADTPSVTNATTNEDTQSVSGLVLERNAADGAEVTYFKITNIDHVTLYQNDGVTQITNNQFITYAEGHAGLKFTPNANLYSPTSSFGFEVQASLNNSGPGGGIGGNPVKAIITVNPVADTPSITNATTFVNLQTANGLVITRNSLDGSEIGFYKITAIANGTLYKADGITPINANQFITATEGAAGLKFTPAQNSTAAGSFNVQASVDGVGTGLSPAATASIAISKYNTSTTIVSVSPEPSYLNQQVTVNYSVSNTSGAAVPTGNVVVTISGGTETCTATAAAGSCALTLTSAGNPRTITATYNSNSQFNGSNGIKTHVVNATTLNPNISGHITLNGNGLAGVTVTLGGASNATVSTNASGLYTFSNLAAGEYTITPARPNFSFALPNRSVTLGATDFTDADFTATSTLASGDLLISEFRLSGSTTDDEFIELYNNTSAAIDLGGCHLDTTAGPVINIPDGTMIPAHGHYLIAHADTYTLASSANADQTYNFDLATDTGLAICNPDGAIMDAVGFASAQTPYAEGNALSAINASAQYSFLRKLSTGTPQDTGDNAADFDLIATDGNATLAAAQLGTPGPENLSSPVVNNDIAVSLVDPLTSRLAAPNLSRVGSGNSGTLAFRRHFTNNTGATVTRLRFRVVDITTLGTPALNPPQSDLRLTDSTDQAISTTLGIVTVRGTQLEQTAAPNVGGGLNTTMTVALPTGGLAAGDSLDVQFLMNVVMNGRFRFFLNVEALP